MAVNKARNWGLLVYPDSAPADWVQRLVETGLKVAISPLHDKDVETDETGQEKPKKPHHHVILVFDGPTTQSVVSQVSLSVNGPAFVKKLASVRGAYEYFTHKNSPEKAPYNPADIQTFNGFDIADWMELSRSEVAKIKQALQKVIVELNFTDYAELMDYVMLNGTSEEYEVASSNTLFFTSYLKGRWYQSQRVLEARR